jgi:hypothetical protein
VSKSQIRKLQKFSNKNSKQNKKEKKKKGKVEKGRGAALWPRPASGPRPVFFLF